MWISSKIGDLHAFYSATQYHTAERDGRSRPCEEQRLHNDALKAEPSRAVSAGHLRAALSAEHRKALAKKR